MDSRIIGWDLVHEYTVAAATVSISWSYIYQQNASSNRHSLTTRFNGLPVGWRNYQFADSIICSYYELILLMRGTKKSSLFNTIIVIIKVSVIIIFIILGWKYISNDNFVPFIPQNTGIFGEYCISGIIRDAAIVFFAFLGFDVVSTVTQKRKNPKRNMPIGILGSLVVCTILYILFTYVMTGIMD